ncbi:hypothetical protein LTR84_010874 [Exophiala bonariae]|uniref:Peptidase S9 prolyl oligopeptidase catalytic domain-containing protein n=1 Tax=Exophiala bonariae TaxID=1690606 RepID=A0AAV9NI04_9EURO|nr:hypothetical protein LTR84_010874 [Exophiala bonariae]
MKSWLWRQTILLGGVWHLAHALQQFPENSSQKGLVLTHASSNLKFSPDWKVLGPFRLGTREAVWGADPVEYLGGITNITYNEDDFYHSPLAADAHVKWESRAYNPENSGKGASIDLSLHYPDIDWQFARQIYGWAALQFQAWIVGELLWSGDSSQTAVLYTDNVLELWVGDNHIFGGDFYSFRRAPILIHLRPGVNVVKVRMLGDIRSMGGQSPPSLQARLETNLAYDVLAVDSPGVIIPDVIKGRFTSLYGSITVRNQAEKWVKIDHIATSRDFGRSILSDGVIWLAPGQSRPLKVVLDLEVGLDKSINFRLSYTPEDSLSLQIDFATTLNHAIITDSHKVTFLHPSGVVSYAILRPPRYHLTSEISETLPVLVALHGAGVEADSPLVKTAFDAIPDLPGWILSPSGMSTWSGDDWHTWGFADVEAAITMIPDWIKNIKWTGPGVCLHRVLVAGHSNGGQGTWFFSTHRPDRVLAAAAASGYTSIENYVPFTLWQEADPWQTAVVQTARGNYRHELLVENLIGIPILQQHGSIDDNVPAYHSRLMNALLVGVGQPANYSELRDRGHWFEGVMTTQSMRDFYSLFLKCGISQKQTPRQFSFIVPNSHDMGSRYGIFVDQLSTPDRMGKVHALVSETESGVQWRLKTTNIQRLRLERVSGLNLAADEVILDNMLLPFELKHEKGSALFVKRDADTWTRELRPNWQHLEQRSGRQRGTLDAILRSSGPFQLIYGSPEILPIALQASRNLHQYYGADSNILSWPDYRKVVDKGESNVITFVQGMISLPTRIPHFPINLQDGRVTLTACNGRIISIPFTQGLGGVWLRPLPDERLELVVWGADTIGLKHAARLVPTITGVGQPDFVILEASARWKGHGGAIAMGLFDYGWRISPGSYLP